MTLYYFHIANKASSSKMRKNQSRCKSAFLKYSNLWFYMTSIACKISHQISWVKFFFLISVMHLNLDAQFLITGVADQWETLLACCIQWYQLCPIMALQIAFDSNKTLSRERIELSYFGLSHRSLDKTHSKSPTCHGWKSLSGKQLPGKS